MSGKARNCRIKNRWTDRRASPRLDVSFDVETRNNADLHDWRAVGVTSNISAGGGYFRMRGWQRLRAGQGIELRMSGTGLNGSRSQLRRLHATGKIVRIDAPAAKRGAGAQAGVAIEFYSGAFNQIYRWLA